MLKLIGHPRSRALRVLWALEEMGLPYDYDPARPGAPEVVALNGTGKIPVLLTDEGPISDSLAILTFLADRHGQLTHPAGSYARARQDSIANYIVTELDAALWLYAKHSFALPEDWRVPDVKPTAQKEFARAMDHIVAFKGDAPFVAGEIFTIADILLSQCAGWGLAIRMQLPGGDFGDYLKSLRERPAMRKAMQIVADNA
ncbi:glutathione S-transferase family protein [Halovulum dunhuangense]|uniref:Glutathione S-transferase family protein n=1 Tax=Halovulum dunhuangense TaxID=1505036 RepID=A0A849KU34_9RHOB|nr:glutathione S-transferase family protein [Halovulum dunhuangense]NNU79081.1 glutathione S-transferase family protein [Halovulum dunhuangense]